MATYMYTSATGNNWDDDEDEDFSFDVYKAAADFSAPTIDDLGPLQRAPAVEDEYNVKQFTAPEPPKPALDFASAHSDDWPSSVDRPIARWNNDAYRRPAYVELSHGDGYAYPGQRHNYNSNWLETKRRMGANMKVPMMMKPSPLQQSMTWEENSAGEYIKEAGFLFPSISSPALSYGSHSDEEQDEALTPPGSPPMALVDEWKGTVEEYDPITAAIDLPTHDKDVEIDVSREFINFNHISDTLGIGDILGNTTRNMLHSYINEPFRGGDSGSHDELEDVLLSVEDTRLKDDDFVGDVDQDQTGKQVEDRVSKPISDLTPDALASYAPRSSPSYGNTDEEEVCNLLTTPSTPVNEGHIHRDPLVDLMTVNTTAHNLIKIIKATQAGHRIYDISIEETTMAGAETTHMTVPVAQSWFGEDVVLTHNKALRLIEFANKVEATVEINTTTAEATHTIVPDAEFRIDDGVAEYNRPYHDKDNDTSVPKDSTVLIKAIGSSSDLKYIQDPSNASLIWNSVAAAWFAISSVPWGRIAISAAGAVVDVIAFVARH